MFKPVSSKADFTKIEEAVLKLWKDQKIPAKSASSRPDAPEFILFERPLTANVKPDVQTLLSWTFKDLFVRFKTMCGYRVTRRFGWNTHGLGVEVEVEKRQNINGKGQIEESGIERFSELCRRSSFDYIYDWEKLAERFGYWVDWQNAFVTHTDDYIETVWWAVKTLWEKGLILKNYAVAPYCPRCGTSLSEMEVATGRTEETKTGVFLRLPLVDDDGTSLLIWTTRPWALSGNVAVAVHPEADYVTVERKLPEGGCEQLILAKSRLEQVFNPSVLSNQMSFLPAETVKIIATFKGKKLRGQCYLPLFTSLLPDKSAFTIVTDETVVADVGTGLVAVSPAYGEWDLRIAVENDLPVILSLQPDGFFVPGARTWQGKHFREVEPFIIEDLTLRGLLFRSETVVETTNYCCYCGAYLMDYLCSAWYMHTKQVENDLLRIGDTIQWIPEETRQLFNRSFESGKDWLLGRERYFGTPLPIWTDEDGDILVVGSFKELADLAKIDLDIISPHRPAIDGITFSNPKTGKLMHRITEVLDANFDASVMAFCQEHHPSNEQLPSAIDKFTADLVCEPVDQIYGWFHALHTTGVMVAGYEVFQKAVCLGHILDADENPISNTAGGRDTFLEHGSDALRWYLLSTCVGGRDVRYEAQDFWKVEQEFIHSLWKVYTFFVTHARSKGWSQTKLYSQDYFSNPLDRWLISSLHDLIRSVNAEYESLSVPGVVHSLQTFVSQLSNWYLNLSHHRFWMSDSQEDEQAAFSVLYQTLTTLSVLIAPILPYLSEEIYQNLVRELDPESPESVHLKKMPLQDEMLIDEVLNREMLLVIRLAELGKEIRKNTPVKIAQSVQEIVFTVADEIELNIVDTYANVLAEVLHVNTVGARVVAGQPFPLVGEQYSLFENEGVYQAVLVPKISPEAEQAGLAYAFVQRMVEMRRQAGFDLTDLIRVHYIADKRLAQTIDTCHISIMRDIIALELQASAPAEGMFVIREFLSGEALTVGIQRI